MHVFQPVTPEEVDEGPFTFSGGKVLVTAEKDGIMFTTISWEPGWTIKVDGKETKPVKLCDALIGVPLTAGEHEIEMTFFPEGLRTGIIFSISGLIAIIALIFFEPKKKDEI